MCYLRGGRKTDVGIRFFLFEKGGRIATPVFDRLAMTALTYDIALEWEADALYKV